MRITNSILAREAVSGFQRQMRALDDARRQVASGLKVTRPFDDPSVELDTGELAEPAPNDPSEILVLAILTLPQAQGEPATANLHGPVALNVVVRRGRQIALESAYGLRHPVDLRACNDQV